MISPVFLSSAMKRCERFAIEPHVEVGVLTMTSLPSIMGDTVRPPCVVKGENSSVIERSHSFFPSFDSAVSRLLTPNEYTFRVSGSAAGDAQPTRCAGTSLWNRLNLYSQSSFPVSALKHISRSCSLAPLPDVFSR